MVLCGVKVTGAFDIVLKNEAKKNRPLWHCFVDKLVGVGIWLIIILLVILRRHNLCCVLRTALG